MSTQPMLRRLLAGLGLIAVLAAYPLTQEAPETARKPTLQVYYLEFVTPDVKGTCELLAATHGVTFGEPDPMLGHARTADLSSGGRLGVRAPMRETEAPVVRTYLRVDDIEAAVATAAEKGGQIAMGATEVPGQGRFAIYLMGGNQFGLWEN
jgi:predicted enzyme related to lactoylglutathione lyase